jgi:hypothetical protein
MLLCTWLHECWGYPYSKGVGFGLKNATTKITERKIHPKTNAAMDFPASIVRHCISTHFVTPVSAREVVYKDLSLTLIRTRIESTLTSIVATLPGRAVRALGCTSILGGLTSIIASIP